MFNILNMLNMYDMFNIFDMLNICDIDQHCSIKFNRIINYITIFYDYIRINHESRHDKSTLSQLEHLQSAT